MPVTLQIYFWKLQTEINSKQIQLEYMGRKHLFVTSVAQLSGKIEQIHNTIQKIIGTFNHTQITHNQL